MNHCNSGTLQQLISAKQRTMEFLAEVEILTIFTQIVLALRHVHSKRIMHRDLKPDNVFVDKQGDSTTFIIGDFGVGSFLSSTVDKAKTFVGTPQYIAPEIHSGLQYGYEADVWALGCILYELCALKKPFDGTPKEIEDAVLSKKPKRIPDQYSGELWSMCK